MSDERSTFERTLQAALAPFSLPLSEPQLGAMWSHFAAVVDANTRFNLTRITDAAEAAVKHYADSLMLAAWAREQKGPTRKLLDVGTGAGFPAVPLAVMQPDWQITAIDSTAKKMAFLSEWIASAHLPNLTALHARAEHWADDARFDVIAFRATGTVAKCLTQARGVVAKKGVVVCYKTRELPAEELAEAQRTAKGLGFRAEPPFEYHLMCGAEVLARQLEVYRQG